MNKPLGIVVAGIGRAGRARVRDISGNILGENMAKLIGVVSRHKPEDMEVLYLTLDEALERDDVDAVVIATENGTHEEYAKKCLEAGKHVLVEFPLTISAPSASEIISLAEKKGLVCHEEDIGLLTPAFKELTEILASKPRVAETEMLFTAVKQPSSWITDIKVAGFPSFSGVNRLHMVYELFGELTVKDAKLIQDNDNTKMVTTLLTKDNRPVVWTDHRGLGNDRTFSFNFKFEDGTNLPYSPRMGPPKRSTATPQAGQPSSGTGGPPSGPPSGLFAKDLLLFVEKVRGKVGAEDQARHSKRALHCLQIAGKIEEMATKEA